MTKIKSIMSRLDDHWCNIKIMQPSFQDIAVPIVVCISIPMTSGGYEYFVGRDVNWKEALRMAYAEFCKVYPE